MTNININHQLFQIAKNKPVTDFCTNTLYDMVGKHPALAAAAFFFFPGVVFTVGTVCSAVVISEIRAVRELPSEVRESHHFDTMPTEVGFQDAQHHTEDLL
jgi:hypothetical protein